MPHVAFKLTRTVFFVFVRAREVLYDFAMDCDDTGKLILKPRPATA